MAIEFLYQQSAVLIAIALFGAMILGAELGCRLGIGGRATQNELTRTQILSIQTTTLALLALLPGFTFSMAISRFEYRKQMVVQESNAIGTAALRSQFLPAFAVLAAAVLGYGDGLAGSRILSLTAAYCVVVVLVIMLIIDLDRPQQGLARTSQQSMIQLQEILDTGRR